MIVGFSDRSGLSHNCHMTEGKKNLWKVTNKKIECYGSKNRKKVGINQENI